MVPAVSQLPGLFRLACGLRRAAVPPVGSHSGWGDVCRDGLGFRVQGLGSYLEESELRDLGLCIVGLWLAAFI